MRFIEADRRWTQENYKPTPLQEQIQKAFHGRSIAHVSCNPFGMEAVISDVCGRLIICAPFVNANKIVTQKAFTTLENEANRLVGMHWLQPVPPKKAGTTKGERIPFFPSATRHGNRWTCGPVEALPVIGPVNPWGKSGFITVTMVGKIQLYYSTPDLNWFQEEQEFFKPEDPAALLSHAAFCSYKENEVFMAALDGHKNIRIVSVKVLWTQQPGQQREHPQLKVDNLACFRLYGPTVEIPMSNNLSGSVVSFMRLIYDRTSAPEDDVMPTLVVGYHSLPVPNVAYGTAISEASTTILRVDIRNAVPELESTFSSLSTKQASKWPLKPQVNLIPLEDIRMEGIVLDIREQSFGRYIAAAFSDGRIQFLDTQFKLLQLDSSPDKVSNLAQIGFSFDAGESCLYNQASSHACIRATMLRGERPKLSAIQVSALSMGTADSAFSEKVAAAFVLEHIGKGSSGDCVDVMVATRAFIDQLNLEQTAAWKTQFLRSLAFAMQVHAKMHEQGLELAQFGPTIQRFLSIQEALGHGTPDASVVGESSPRTASSHLAWILQNLRQHMIIVWVLMIRQNSHPGQAPEIRSPEATQALGYYSEWCSRLAEWVVGQILAANRALNFPRTIQELGFSPNQVVNHIPVSARIAGALIMLPLGRTCFKIFFLGVTQLAKVMETIPPHELPEQWRPLEKSLKERVFMQSVFIKFLESVDDICKRIFAQPGNSAAKDGAEQQAHREMIRRATETETLIEGRCEGLLASVMGMLVSQGAWNLRDSCNENDIVFADYAPLAPLPAEDGLNILRSPDVIWDGNRKFVLGRQRPVGADKDDDITDDGGSGKHSGDSDVDSAVFLDEGIELSTKWTVNGQRIPNLRICVRCANIMEDQSSPRTRSRDYLLQLMRQCYCGGHWVELANL